MLNETRYFVLDVCDNYVVHSNTGHYFLHVLCCPWCIITVEYIIFLRLYLLSGVCPHLIMQTCSTMLNTYIERLKRIKWMAVHYIQWTVCLMNICSRISLLCFCNIWEPFLTRWLIHILIFNMTYFIASYKHGQIRRVGLHHCRIIFLWLYTRNDCIVIFFNVCPLIYMDPLNRSVSLVP